MKKQARKQKGFSPILTIIVVGVVIVVIAIFLSTQKGNITQQTTQSVPAIQDAGGLNTVASELDNTDLNAVDKELNQLDADASTF